MGPKFTPLRPVKIFDHNLKLWRPEGSDPFEFKYGFPCALKQFGGCNQFFQAVLIFPLNTPESKNCRD
jgi:hypothetical protein